VYDTVSKVPNYISGIEWTIFYFVLAGEGERWSFSYPTSMHQCPLWSSVRSLTVKHWATYPSHLFLQTALSNPQSRLRALAWPSKVENWCTSKYYLPSTQVLQVAFSIKIFRKKKTVVLICIISSASTQVLSSVWHNTLGLHGDELEEPRPTPKQYDHPVSVVRDCLLNIFTAARPAVKIWARSQIWPALQLHDSGKVSNAER
jgi:hypothetical protein